ncbi:MAG TPA: ubiquinone/menaquinone biosynthesis methyltransferase [Candidatus Sumerlaeota bacterium]|nr:ubiquinone/menaquinone biosynthesis methyltransferase [Candidatus Sumerlaeota bacterium]
MNPRFTTIPAPLDDPPPAPAADDQSPEKIRAMFGAITPTYDRLNRLLSGRRDEVWRRRAARAALDGLQPCRAVADVATGTGDLACALLRELARRPGSSTAHVVGLDFTRPMLAAARRKFSDARLAWAEADGLRLPLRSASVDAATIAFGLRNMADKPAALRELVRVVRPGGRVVILEFSQPPNPLFRALYDFYSFQVMPRLGHWLSRSDAYLYLGRSIRRFWSPDELTRQMQAAGLTRIRAVPLMLGVVYLHVGERGEASAP